MSDWQHYLMESLSSNRMWRLFVVDGQYTSHPGDKCACGKVRNPNVKVSMKTFTLMMEYLWHLRCLSDLDFKLFRLLLLFIVLIISVVLIYVNSFHSNQCKGSIVFIKKIF